MVLGAVFTRSFRYPNVVELTICGMKHSDTMRLPKSFDAGVPSGAGASSSSCFTGKMMPSSHAVIASEATISTRSHDQLLASAIARSFATASEAESSFRILTPGLFFIYGPW